MIESGPQRILVIDDNRAIHEDFRKILSPEDAPAALDAMESTLFETEPAPERRTYQVNSAFQGEEGLELVKRSIETGGQYPLAFVDMRMPPGWDGVQTIQKIWEIDPEMQIVICSAYSDYSWEEIQSKLGVGDRLLILKKPFDTAEVCQLASALTEKWHLARRTQRKLAELDGVVLEQVREIETTQQQLLAEVEQRITERKASEAQLRFEALHDPLTRLANRALLSECLTHDLARARREPQFNFGLLHIDLDHFKVINDSLGQVIGDKLLVAVSERLVKCARESDTVARAQTDQVARIGGDEFVILLDDLADPADALRVAERIHGVLATPFHLDGHELFAHVSIGIATGDPRYQRAEEILRDADTALSQAKEAGKGCTRIFDPVMHERAMTRWRTESELRHAIDQQEIVLHYQPIMTADGQLAALEALARWQHPTRGMIPPDRFIPVAEETGLIVPLGRSVLTRACGQLRHWQTVFPWLTELSVGVNVSSKQFARSSLVDDVAGILRESGLHPRCLKLEITESAAMENAEQTIHTLSRLKEMGVLIDLDDFGTGYSSLSHLHRMPIDAMKIDRGFVVTMEHDAMSRSIIQAVIAIAHSMNLRVIAEGVETQRQMEALCDVGCDYMQGYFFCKPMSVEKTTEFLSQRYHKIPGDG